MSEQRAKTKEELIKLQQQFKNDPVIQKMDEQLGELHSKALPRSITVKDGDIDYLYSEQMEKAMKKLKRQKDKYIRSNYPELISDDV